MPPNWVIWHSAQKSCEFVRKSRVVGIYFLRKSEGLLVRYMHTITSYNPCIAAITAWCVAGHEFQLGALFNAPFKMDCNLALDMNFGLMHCGTCCVLVNVAANTHCNLANSLLNSAMNSVMNMKKITGAA